MISRRGFLGLLLAAGCGAEISGERLTSRLPLPPKFARPLALPRTAKPESPGRYVITQRAAKVEIIPGTTTEIWGYDGTFPGPTFDLSRGDLTVVTIRNDLTVPTSTHLHGGVTPADSDGHPTDLVVGSTRPHHHEGFTLHDRTRDYVYPLDQQAATLWYHDHRMDFTGPQVYRGLAGFFLIRDDEEARLGLPEGDRELPLMICDRSFEADGSFRYPALDPSLLLRHGVRQAYMEGVEGDVVLVNGVPWPYGEVEAVRYRLRLLNASNARRYRLALRPGGSFTQIGSDQGLLERPLQKETITIAPGERYDVIVDFAQYPIGSHVTLTDLLGGDVMRFTVTRRARDDSRVPSRLTDPQPVDNPVAHRTFDFRVTDRTWTINGHPYAPGRPMATPRLGTTEIWRFVSDFHHPVHVHLGRFKILGREDQGWKDTVDVRPYETVEVAVRFDGHRGRYMIHCHNLEHEDMAMMADFDVV
ncbi:multicopper oxidase family protein [Herbidospora mongoliensis]|uniref:multicopper oxidase family protein n=1 Tax=Herbidospora mongoliensis TaxID=688067 RepID=UPI000836F0B3|nr:multicopper oxidase family protein [Herbidospora mongoliensis]